MKSTKVIAKVFAVLAGSLLLAHGSNAATVQVEWQNPDDFRDIRATNGGQQKFQEQVMGELEEQFRAEADQLAADQTLFIAVEDVDLAGEIEYFHNGHPFGLRVIRRVDSPSLTLRYELRDASDKVISSGEERIRDMGFRFSNLLPNDRSPLKYEKEMIRDWYRESFGKAGKV